MSENLKINEPAHFDLNYQQTMDFYAEAMRGAFESGGAVAFNEVRAELGRTDLFFLLVFILKLKVAMHPWIFARCRDVQRDPNDHLDLWGREHFKSSVITFALTIFDIINNPEITVAILSHTKAIARGFLKQIKKELEQNEDLWNLYPDVFYREPAKNSPRWSVDGGIEVKRTQNPKEATVEGHGLVDGMPTGGHYKLLVYDDVVTKDGVNTAEQIHKTTEAFQMSDNLGSEGGHRRYIGTRYHLFDTYSVMIDQKIAIPRIHPATYNGKEHGIPVLLSRETLEKKRRAQGPYVFSCFPSGSPVLMADWTEKNIEDLKVGDELVGYDFPKNKKTKLVRSRVLAVNSKIHDVYEYIFESGRVVRATKEHKWYTGRRGKDVGGTDSNSSYLQLGFKKNELKSLISIYDPRVLAKKYDPHLCGWLSGFFDGEGSVSGGCIHLHQSQSHNPTVCTAIEETLKALDFDFGVFEKHSLSQINKKIGHGKDYYIRGGRQEKIRFLNLCKPIKRKKIEDFLFQQGTREFGKACRDNLISINYVGKENVYNIETITGNYVCYGYATKNSQMLLNPVADSSMGFRREWLIKEDIDKNTAMKRLWRFIIVDPAGGKQRKDNDYTTMFVIGYGEDQKFRVLDIRRDRMRLTQKADTLMELHRLWKPQLVAYEEYGMQADIEHIEFVQKQQLYEFAIYPLGGSMKKELRILRLVPYFENGRIIFPTYLHQKDYQDQLRDLVKDFEEEEFVAFPVLKHDDMLDCLARIEDLVAEKLIQSPIITNVNPESEVNKRLAAAKNKIANGSKPAWMN